MSDVLDRAAAASGDLWLLLGRLALAAIFIPSGFGKLTHLGGFEQYLVGHGLPAFFPLAVVGACVEFFGSIAVALGLFTRYAALLMLLFGLAAAFIGHSYWNLADAAQMAAQRTQFLKDLAIAGGFLVLFVAGPGRISVDRRGRAAVPATA